MDFSIKLHTSKHINPQPNFPNFPSNKPNLQLQSRAQNNKHIHPTATERKKGSQNHYTRTPSPRNRLEAQTNPPHSKTSKLRPAKPLNQRWKGSTGNCTSQQTVNREKRVRLRASITELGVLAGSEPPALSRPLRFQLLAVQIVAHLWGRRSRRHRKLGTKYSKDAT